MECVALPYRGSPGASTPDAQAGRVRLYGRLTRLAATLYNAVSLTGRAARDV